MADFEINRFFLFLFLIGSILPDIDYILTRISDKTNHRELITHFPLLYLLGSITTLILNIPIFWLCIGCLFHTLIDTLDFEIYLFAPIHPKSYSIIGINYKNIRKNKTIMKSLKLYYKNGKIITVEILSILLLVISTIL
ncbi:MAG: metal-dependent hydrolase [Candidatus Hodarchaeota archaeon]